MTTLPLSPQAAVNAWRHLEEGEHDGVTIRKAELGVLELRIRGDVVPTIMRVIDQALQHGRSLEGEELQLVEAKRAAEQGGHHLVHVPKIAGSFDVGPPTLSYAPGSDISLRTVRRGEDDDLTEPGELRYWSVAYDGSLLETDDEGLLLDMEWGDDEETVEVLTDEGVLGRVRSWVTGAQAVLDVAIVEGEHQPFLKGYAAAVRALQRHVGES